MKLRFKHIVLSASLVCTVLWGSVVMAQSIAVLGAPGNPTWNDDVVAKISAAGSFDSVTGMNVSSSTPTSLELSAYNAVLVYSDTSFADADGLGDVLADYVDAGGGVVVATFAFWDSGINIGGRLASGGYLPFTQAGQNSPGGLTLVPVIADHPLLDGVTSFNGGTASYHNSVIDIAGGATLVANWSNGQPLIGTLTLTAGTVVGLNFYPPSSDARGDFWDSATDGDQLMVNALGFSAGDVAEAAPVPSLSALGLLMLLGLMLMVGTMRLRKSF